MVSVGIPMCAIGYCGHFAVQLALRTAFNINYHTSLRASGLLLDWCHGVLIFFPTGTVISCTVISSLRVKYGWIVYLPALSGHLDWTKVNTLDIIGSRQIHRFTLLTSISDESNRLINLSISPRIDTGAENVSFNDIPLRASAFNQSYSFL